MRAMMMMGALIPHACQFASVNLLLDYGGLTASFSTVSYRTVYYSDLPYGEMIQWFWSKGEEEKGVEKRFDILIGC